jgi:two-component system nitrogen regulation sensor histidine kinase GlnL
MIPETDALRLLDSLSTAVLLFDSRLRLQAMNGAAEALLSLSRRQARTLSVDELLPEFPRFGVAVRRAMLRRNPVIEREMQMKIADARFVIVDCTVTPVMADETVDAVLVELNNVDRHHRVTREEHMIAQSNVTDALVRGMAHEIKNPLGGIRGAAQLLEDELPADGLKDYTRIIVGEVDRLRKLLDELLTPAGAVVRARANIHEVLEHVRGLVEAEARGHVSFQLDYDPSLPELCCDRDQLVQAFLNVVRNAVQATGRGGRVVLRTRAGRQLTIGSRRHRLAIRIDVADNGPGVPKEIADSIFFPMVSGRAGGSGLGLSIAQTLIRRHGGLIEFDSTPMETVFTTWLPIVDDA